MTAITAMSSHGTFSFDDKTGKVLSIDLDTEFGQLPLTVDVFEYKNHYTAAFTGDVDVLDIGYWTVDGLYAEPDHRWRVLITELRAEWESSEYNAGFSE